MEEPYSRVYAEINLDNIIKNMETMAAGLPSGTGIIGVVKTDGYGHGAVPVAKAIDPFVCGYAVAAVEEGIILRKHKITKPVLILSAILRSFWIMISGRLSMNIPRRRSFQRLP